MFLRDDLSDGEPRIRSTLVIEHLNLLSDPFIQNRVHLRAVGSVYPRRGALMNV